MLFLAGAPTRIPVAMLAFGLVIGSIGSANAVVRRSRGGWRLLNGGIQLDGVAWWGRFMLAGAGLAFVVIVLGLWSSPRAALAAMAVAAIAIGAGALRGELRGSLLAALSGSVPMLRFTPTHIEWRHPGKPPWRCDWNSFWDAGFTRTGQVSIQSSVGFVLHSPQGMPITYGALEEIFAFYKGQPHARRELADERGLHRILDFERRAGG